MAIHSSTLAWKIPWTEEPGRLVHGVAKSRTRLSNFTFTFINLAGREVGGNFKRQGTYIYLWLIHVDVWQKPTQYCKAITTQLKINKLKKKDYIKAKTKYAFIFKHCKLYRIPDSSSTYEELLPPTRKIDGQYRNQTDHILCSWRQRSSIQSVKTRPEAGCGSDDDLLTAKIRFKLKKVGKITRLFKTIKVKESEVAHSCPKARPFSYDLNQIPYNYTVEVTNRFTILDLMDRVPEELWREVHDTVQESVIKTIPKKKKSKKSKWLSEEALQIAE